MSSLPTFIGIGSQRCGSTWLYTILQSHPDVYVTRPKELKFFSQRILKHDLDWYQKRFEPAKGTVETKVRGEITPMYTRLSPVGIRTIAQLVPDLRVILVMRNPIDRLWSQAQYELGHLKGKRLSGISVERFLLHFERYRSRIYSEYDRILTMWSEVFGEDAIHADLYDRLREEPREFARDVFGHIGADPSWDIPEDLVKKKVYTTADLTKQTLEMPEVIRWYLASQWLEPTRRLNERLGGRVTPWVEEMRDLSEGGAVSWRLLRQVNRWLLALPERVAFAAFDGARRARLARRYQAILRQHRQDLEAVSS